MKILSLLLVLITLTTVLGGCAQGGATTGGAGSGSMTMYGTIDQGISYTSH
jgi:hypothetical protein